jgi:hypothetical protein
MKKSIAANFLSGAVSPARRNVFLQLGRAGLLALLVASASSHAQSYQAQYLNAQSGFEQDFDDLNKPWQEIAIQLPPVPKKENLLEFDAGPTTKMSFYIDAASLSVGDDGVVRYTLVSRSPSGAENISYEGIRCATQERKLYAFGRSDGNWARSRRDQWERFTGTIANRQHATLAKSYFCSSQSIEGNTEQITRRIRDKRPLMGDVFSP